MCVSPISVRINNGFSRSGYMLVPCGKCVECLSAYQNGWKIRIMEETHEWDSVAFLTLTYRDTFDAGTFEPKYYKFNPAEIRLPSKLTLDRYEAHVKNDYISSCVPYSVVIDEDTGEERRYLSTSRKHLQNWLKRCRIWYKREYGSDAEFKYFYCTEYGPRTMRPHAHCLIFFNKKDTDFIKFMCDDWYLYHGHVDMSFPKGGDAEDIRSMAYQGSLLEKAEKCANYVSKYCSKGVLFENPRVEAKLVEPCVRRSSKFLGAAYVGKHIDEVLCRNWFRQHRIEPGSQYYGRFNEGYLEAVRSQLKWHSSNNEFTYKLPKYYVQKFFRRDTRKGFTKRTDSERIRHDSKSPLEIAFSAYILSLADSVYLRKLRILRAEHPSWTDSQIYLELANSEKNALEFRRKSREKSLREFYEKSKL